MSDNNIPKSHGRFGNEEIGAEFTNQENKSSGKINIVKKLFKKKQKKANEVARQNLE